MSVQTKRIRPAGGNRTDSENVARSVTIVWSFWLIEDAPAPVDPDAAAIEAIITAYRRSPECSTDAVFCEAMLDHLRAQGFDVTPRAEQ